MVTAEPIYIENLQQMRDQLIQGSHIRASLVDRGISRVQQRGVLTAATHWVVKGRRDLHDDKAYYRVHLLGGQYVCTCIAEALCSHIAAVIVQRRVQEEEPKDNKPRLKPSDLGLPAKFTNFYNLQLEALERVKQSDKKWILINAPTGTGKTLLAAAIQRIMRTRILYVCTTKQLQSQFMKDFPYAVELKGRSNYPTLNHGEDFPRINAGLCQRSGQEHCPLCCRGDDQHTDLGEDEGCYWQNRCPYKVQKLRALKADIAVLNIQYFLLESNFVGQFSNWPLTIIDEGDLTTAALMSFVELEITERWIKRLKLDAPEHKTVEASWITWARDEALPKVLHRLEEMRGRWGVDGAREKDELERMEGKLRWFLNAVGGGGWTFTATEDRWTFKPTWVAPYAEQFLWRHGKRFVVMSATIISPDQFARDLGIPRNQVEWIDLPMMFPKANRPIYYRPAVSMTHKNKQSAWPVMTDAVDALIDQYPQQKGLIHTVSYSLAAYICQHSKHKKRLITYGAGAREQTLERFKSSTQPLVLIAPSMERGVDLAEDLCRFLAVVKMPFADLSDKQVNKRLYASKDGKSWYAVETIRSLCQATGRGVRSSTDTCDSYILDAQFAEFFQRWRNVFPKWWTEALHLEPK